MIRWAVEGILSTTLSAKPGYLRAISSLMTSLSLQTLPEDLLAGILALACEASVMYAPEGVQLKHAYVLMRVCKSFRDLIRGSQAFWAHLPVALTSTGLPHPGVYQWLTRVNVDYHCPVIRGPRCALSWSNLRELRVRTSLYVERRCGLTSGLRAGLRPSSVRAAEGQLSPQSGPEGLPPAAVPGWTSGK